MSLRRIVENGAQNATGPNRILGVPVRVMDRVGFDVGLVSNSLSQKFPRLNLSSMIDVVYIGDFEFLRERDIEAAFMEDAVYLMNTVTPDEVVDHLTHEISHVLERKVANDMLYLDGRMEREYINKITELRRRLLQDPEFVEDVQQLSRKMYSPEFDTDVDQFFLKKVGYDSMRILSTDLFIDPYAASSLSEYYATGFETFFSNEKRDLLRAISPVLHEKLVELENMMG